METKQLLLELSRLKVKTGLSKGIWKKLAPELPAGSMLEAAGTGVDPATGGKAAVVVTADTVYIGRPSNTFGGFDLSTCRREDVKSVDYSGSILCTLTIGTPGGALTVENIGKHEAKVIAAVLRG